MKKCVAGLGITGVALLEYFVSQGVACVGFEELSEDNFKKAQQKFKGTPVELFFGDLPSEVFEEVDEFFQSPGIPLTRPWVQKAQAKEIPVLGELEFASRFLKGSLIAVTGTNGKSTTVTLLDAILTDAGYQSSLKGNIGSPLVTAITEVPKQFYVIEASSYQLETIRDFRPKIAVVLNVTPDHLDRYNSIQDYAKAKERVGQNQKDDDTFIFNHDDLFCLKMSQRAKGHAIPFSLVNQFPEGGFIDKDDMVIRLKGTEHRYPLSECRLKGLHNQENMLASILAAELCGASKESIQKTLQSFAGLSHRVQMIGSFKGMDFYDDSKGTNVGSVVMSLASFEKGVILILGGRDKGGDYSPLKALIKAKAKALIVLGEARDIIKKSLDGFAPLYQVTNMQQAVQKSFEVGEKGDVVLLSPACSSFDQYKNYAERGDDFKKWALKFGEE